MPRAAFADRTRVLWLAGLLLSASACGGARPGSVSEPRRALTEVDALQRDFDVSEARLTEQLQLRQSALASAEEAPPAAPPPPPETAAGANAAEEAKGAAAAERAGAAPPADPVAEAPQADTARPEPFAAGRVGSPCDLMCRALSSMQRSAEGICGLTGEHDRRCEGARARLKLATQQVERAHCACRP